MIDSPDALLSNTASLSRIPTDAFDETERLESERLAEDETALLINSPLVEELSLAHVGQWNTLVSRTNWEKGAVILRWRETMLDAELPRAAYSDEAWARRVGNVSAQHVGRLRRVSERFADHADGYPNLYWSHFQAALDWNDAELWLEGAVQNGWSVAQMRVQRWEAIGAPDELKPRTEDVFTAELDEDVNPRNDSFASSEASRSAGRTEARTAEIGAADMVDRFDADEPPFDPDGDASPKQEPKKPKTKAVEDDSDGPSTGELLASLGDLAAFPADLGEALAMLKVAILHHKLAGWKDISPPKLLKKIDALKGLIFSVDEA